MALYVVAFILVNHRVGLPGALAIIPVVVCGWSLGRRGGFLAGAGIGLITVLLSVALGDGWQRVLDTWLGLALLPLAGGAVGWYRQLYQRMQAQAAELRQAQTELSRWNTELEARVQERTRALSQSNLKLAEANKTLETLIASSPLAIIVTDVRGLIQRLNPAFLDLSGWTEPELLGRPVSDLMLPENRGDFANLNRVLQAGGVLHNFETRRLTRGGRPVDVSISTSAIHADGGEVAGYISVLADVTTRREAEAEIRRLNADLERRVTERTVALTAANAELGAYNNMVAHDLRGPLTLLQNYADVLKMHYAGQVLDEQGLQLLEGMQEALVRMRLLIQDLFDFSRAKEDRLLRQPVDLSALARAVVEDLRQGEPQRQVAVEIAPGLTAHGDERFLRLVLDNLLGNAWKYTGQTEGARIEFGAQAAEGSRAMWVRDNGVGFDARQADRLFQPFQRLTNEFPGTGLGLATCKRVVERHGGQIWAESELGRGATIYFTLGDHS